MENLHVDTERAAARYPGLCWPKCKECSELYALLSTPSVQFSTFSLGGELS